MLSQFSGKKNGVGWHFLLQGIFLTQGSNQHLLYWQAENSLLLSYLGSHRTLVAQFKNQSFRYRWYVLWLILSSPAPPGKYIAHCGGSSWAQTPKIQHPIDSRVTRCSRAEIHSHGSRKLPYVKQQNPFPNRNVQMSTLSVCSFRRRRRRRKLTPAPPIN